MPTRTANAMWEGRIREGKGRFGGESGAIGGDYSFGGRFGDAGGTNPEELLAAAWAACYSMALSGNLERAGMAPERIETSAAVTIEKAGDGFRVTTGKLTVRATAPGADRDAFKDVAEATKGSCPISLVMLGNVEMEVEATLEGE